MSSIIIVRQTKEEWEAQDIALPNTFLGVESDIVDGEERGTLQAKLFDGIHTWNELDYWNPSGGGGGSALWGTITGTLSNQSDLQSALNAKQVTLISGTNIKTVGGTSLLGSGNVTVGTAWGDITGTLSNQTDLQTALTNAGETATWGDITGDITDQADLEAAINLTPTFLMRFTRPIYPVVAANVNVAADTITVTDHRLATGTRANFDQTWGGFTINVSYYVIVVDANTIKMALTYGDAKAGVAIDITGTPTGTTNLGAVNGHHVFAGYMHQKSSEMTYTFGDAQVHPSTDTITLTGHAFETGYGLQLNSSWGGLTTGTLYYAIKVDANNIKLASTYLAAIAGTAVDITADPGGTVTLFETYGDFYADALVTPRLGAEYVFSVGYGGAHILLFGFDGGSNGRIGLTGNLSAAIGGSVDVGLTSGTEECFIGYPVHIAVLRSFGTATVFFNGVPAWRIAKPTGRGAFDPFDQGMYIGGSDHSNYAGDMYWVRYFENRSPVYFDPNIASILRVSTRPLATYFESTANRYVTANLLLNFSQPATTIANLGTPLVPGRTNEGHRAAGTDADIFADFNSFEENELPQQIRSPLPSKPHYGLTPTAPPVGVKIFDSFKRDDVAPIWDNTLGLGSTESGSLGVKRWQQINFGTPYHGILFGRAYVSGAGSDVIREYVTSNSAFMKVEIKNNGNETAGAVLFGAYDFTADTGIKAVASSSTQVSLYKVVAGVPTGLGFTTVGANAPYTMGVQYTSGKHMQLLINGVVQVDFDDSGSSALTGTQAGFTASVGYCRFEDFAVFAASA